MTTEHFNTILICDFDEDTHDILKEKLSDEYKLIIFDNPNLSVHAVNSTPDVSLLLLNITSEDFTELHTLAQIREEHPNVKIIAIADHNSIDRAEEAMLLGANGIILLPLDNEDILSAVADLPTE